MLKCLSWSIFPSQSSWSGPSRRGDWSPPPHRQGTTGLLQSTRFAFVWTFQRLHLSCSLAQHGVDEGHDGSLQVDLIFVAACGSVHVHHQGLPTKDKKCNTPTQCASCLRWSWIRNLVDTHHIGCGCMRTQRTPLLSSLTISKCTWIERVAHCVKIPHVNSVVSSSHEFCYIFVYWCFCCAHH